MYNVPVHCIRTRYRYGVHDSLGIGERTVAVSASTVSAGSARAAEAPASQGSRRWWALAAVTLATLITRREVQGIGASLLMPTALAIIMATFTNVRERSTAIGIWAAVSALALAAGPVVGGLISQHVRWGWIFLINVPVGVITLVITVLFVAESRAETAARRLDLPGLATSALALFALTYALIEGNVRGWTSPPIVAAFAGAAVAFAAFLAA